MHFKPFRLLPFLASLVLATMVTFTKSWAVVPYDLTGGKNLNLAADFVKNSLDTGVFVVSISSFKDIGQFKLDGTSLKIDSLIFQPKSLSETDSAINVDSTLMILKKIRGTVVLRGLAFNFRTPLAALIAGSEIGKENGNLIIDSCFIYSEGLSGTFLSWASSSAGNIEIRRSFFVSKAGNALDARINLSGGNISITNNLFNFPGAISATISKKVEFISNTVNRTQCDFSVPLAVGGIPTYDISLNLVAFPGTVDAYGSSTFWALRMGDFNQPLSHFQYNEISTLWQGYDYPSGSRFNGANNNTKLAIIPNRSVSTLWDWDIPGKITGFGTGAGKRSAPYNVLPESTSIAFKMPIPVSLASDSISAQAVFSPAIFPRQFKPEYLPSDLATLSANPDLRFYYPTLGELHFGPFTLQTLSVNIRPSHGNPLLLSKTSEGTYLRQAEDSSSQGANSSLFMNSLAGARSYLLAFKGNTKTGLGIVPEKELKAKDSLYFAKVDSAGYTLIRDNGNFPPGLTSEIRVLSLEASINFSTTAEVSGNMIYGTKAPVSAYQTSQIKWLVVGPPNKLRTAFSKSVGATTLYFDTLPAAKSLQAFLVEILSVPAGIKTFVLQDGTLQSISTSGYQLTIDSALTPSDTVQYGQYTHAYGASSIGRGPTDELILKLNWKPGLEVYNDLGNKNIQKMDILPDSTGKVQISLAQNGVPQKFFLAMKYNITADSLYNKFGLDTGVILLNFRSSKSAKMVFQNLTSSIKEQTWVRSDSVFGSTNFLAGTRLLKNGAVPDSNWGMIFRVPAPNDVNRVETWWSDGRSWNKLVTTPPPGFLSTVQQDFQITGLPAQAEYIVVVERLAPAVNYVVDSQVLTAAKDGLVATATYVNPLASTQTITSYCLQLKYVLQNGIAITTDCNQKAIGQPDTVNLVPNVAYVSRVQYFQVTGNTYGSSSFQPVLGAPTWDKNAVLPKALAVKTENEWHLIGYPFDGSLQKSLVPDTTSVSRDSLAKAGILDTIYVLNSKREAGKPPSLDTLKNWPLVSFKAGDAFLIGATRAFDMVMPPESQFLPVKPVKRAVGVGWHFLSNPFPTSFATSLLSTTKGDPSLLWNLVAPLPGTGAKYTWEPTSTMKAFFGYAYYAKADDSLVFDLLATAPVAKAAATSGIAKVVLEAQSASSQVFLKQGQSENDVPFLSAPAAGLELRIGGGTGYLLKNISDWNAVDESVEIRSVQAGRAGFSIEVPEAAISKGGFEFRLVDLASGMIYDAATAQSIPLTAGSHDYRLIAGTPEFVKGSIRSFLAQAPAVIGLSQNYPNPARGLTRITLEWPTTQDEERNATLQILDTRGREVRKIILKGMHVGAQELQLDVSGWNPGIYLYRLTVSSGRKSLHVQKRMLVSP